MSTDLIIKTLERSYGELDNDEIAGIREICELLKDMDIVDVGVICTVGIAVGISIMGRQFFLDKLSETEEKRLVEFAYSLIVNRN